MRDGKIVDLLSVDGGSQTPTSHSDEVYLVPQGLSILSPYLVAFAILPAKARWAPSRSSTLRAAAPPLRASGG
jgi:hypothetical protein